jgi:hypothetical protein
MGIDMGIEVGFDKMAEDPLLEWVFKGIVGTVITIFGWFYRSVSEDLKALQKEHNDFKLDVVNTYAKESSVQMSLGRIHDRLDSISEDIKALIKYIAEKK